MTNIRCFHSWKTAVAFVITAKTSTSVRISTTRLRWILLPVATGVACGLIKISRELLSQFCVSIQTPNRKNNKLASFAKLKRICSQDKVVDKKLPIKNWVLNERVNDKGGEKESFHEKATGIH